MNNKIYGEVEQYFSKEKNKWDKFFLLFAGVFLGFATAVVIVAAYMS